MLAPRGSSSKIIVLIAAVASFSNFLEGYSSSYPNTAGEYWDLLGECVFQWIRFDLGLISQEFSSCDSFRSVINISICVLKTIPQPREFINGSYIARGSGPLTSWEFTWFWSLLLNIWFVGYLAGTLCTPSITDNYGRKNGLCLANTISLLGTLLIIVGLYLYLPELLLIGRTVAAVGSGLSFGSLILFIQETTPTNLRGTCSFLSEVSYIAVNVVGMGMGMDVLLGRNLLALVGFGALPGLISILIVLPLQESPKFLLINRGNREGALKSLNFYQGIQLDNHSVSIGEMMKEMADGKKGGDLSLGRAVMEVFKQPHLRKAVFIGTLSLQIIVGIWPIIYISTDLLEAHFDANASQYSSFSFISANFVASIIGACTVEKFGRRPMLIWCGVANTLCLCTYTLFDRMTTESSIFFLGTQFKYGCIVSLIAYGITYGTALGPIAFFITSELVPQRFRSLVQSIVFFLNTIINFIFSFITLPLYVDFQIAHIDSFQHFQELIDVWSFIPLFIIPSTLSIIYLIREMPETKGREIHEIVEQLKKGGGAENKQKKSEATGQSISDSTTTSSPGGEENFPPEFVLPSCGHAKNSLIKTAAGGAAIAAAVAKLTGQQRTIAEADEETNHSHVDIKIGEKKKMRTSEKKDPSPIV